MRWCSTGFDAVAGFDQPIIDTLVIPLPMIVRGILASGLSQRLFAEENHSAETLILDRSDEAFSEGIQVGQAVGQSHDFDSGLFQEIAEGQREPRVARAFSSTASRRR
jgi:hypothetical protein